MPGLPPPERSPGVAVSAYCVGKKPDRRQIPVTDGAVQPRSGSPGARPNSFRVEIPRIVFLSTKGKGKTGRPGTGAPGCGSLNPKKEFFQREKLLF